MQPPSDAHHVIVAGTGPAGLAAALALADNDLPVTLVGPEVTPDRARADRRTTALFGGSIELLRHIQVWSGVAADAAPLVGLRLIDDTPGLLRAPELLFEASEIGRSSFGFNVENSHLLMAMWEQVRSRSGIRHVSDTLVSIAANGSDVRAGCASGAELRANLLVGADGRHSVCRAGAHIGTRAWIYPQSALVTTFSHSRGHGGISTEFHRRAGPLTTVPLTGNRSSLVWVETAQEASRLLGLPEATFRDELDERLQGLLGAVGDLGPRAAFPLSGLVAEPMAQRRVALIGEAAHVMPPIGAQGLNLGLRDVAWLAEIAGGAARDGADIGGEATLSRFTAARSFDVRSRELVVDLLNRSLYLDFAGLDMARGLGIAALIVAPWLKRQVMRQGIGPGGSQPRLLQPPASGA